MSYLSYNGIKIDFLTTDEITHEPVRADDGSYLYTRVTIQVTGLIYGTPSQSQAPTSTPVSRTANIGTTPTATIQGIRAALMQERATLLYTLEDGATPLILSPALDGNNNPLPCDCNNGPVPELMSLSDVTGISSVAVRFRVTTWIKECPGYSGPNGPDALLSNRSYQTHSINEQHLTTIETVGQAVFRTDVLEQAKNQADHYRYLLFGPVPKGCKRVAVNIQATPGRNTLTYRYVDQERFFDIGETGPTGSNTGIVDCKFIYGVSSTGAGGGPVSPVTMHRVTITVIGNKSASHWRMTQAAFSLAQTKLPISDTKQGFLTNISCTQHMHDRVVVFDAAMMLQSHNGGGGIPGLNVDGLQIDAVFPAAGGINPALPSRSGTAGTYQNELLTTAWKGACAPATKSYTEGKYTGEDNTPYDSPDTGPIVSVSVSTGSQAPTLPSKYSPAQQIKPYVSYKVDIQVNARSGKVQVPIAGNPNSSSASSSNPPPTCAILTLAYPTEQMLVNFEAERIGTPPSVPAFKSTDPNRVILDSNIQTAEPQLMVDGVTRVFTVRGWAKYALQKPGGNGSSMAFPQSPMQTGTYGQLALTPDLFISGIVDPVTPIT